MGVQPRLGQPLNSHLQANWENKPYKNEKQSTTALEEVITASVEQVGFGLHNLSGTVYGSVAARAVQKGLVGEIHVHPGHGGEEKLFVGWEEIWRTEKVSFLPDRWTRGLMMELLQCYKKWCLGMVPHSLAKGQIWALCVLCCCVSHQVLTCPFSSHHITLTKVWHQAKDVDLQINLATWIFKSKQTGKCYSLLCSVYTFFPPSLPSVLAQYSWLLFLPGNEG